MTTPVVVGLGNPGRRHKGTRHNAGLLVLDDLARRHGARWRQEGRSEAATWCIGAEDAILLKSQTCTNRSRAALLGYESGSVVVVHGGVDLPSRRRAGEAR